MLPILPQPLEDYCAAHSSAPSPLLDELERHTRTHCAFPQMLVGPLEGAFLKLLVKLTGARRILEIGLFTGYSALTMAEALPDDGELISCDIDAANAAIADGIEARAARRIRSPTRFARSSCRNNRRVCGFAQSFFDRSPHGRKITIRLGAALDTLQTFPAGRQFDLVFLDADDVYGCTSAASAGDRQGRWKVEQRREQLPRCARAAKENYINYYEAVLSRVKPGGLIVADNVLWSAKVLNPVEKTDDVHDSRDGGGRAASGTAAEGSTSVAGGRMQGATRAIVAFNAHVRADPRVEKVMLGVREGVLLIRKL